MPFIATAGLMLSMILDNPTTGPGGWAYFYGLIAIVVVVWPTALGFSVASFALALAQLSKISRFERATGVFAPGAGGAVACACFSAAEAIIPLLLIGRMLIMDTW